MDLNIRHVPDELVKRLKIKATANCQTLREFSIAVLQGSLNEKTYAERAPNGKQVTCPLCGLEGLLVMSGTNARCWHCGSGFVPPEGQ